LGLATPRVKPGEDFREQALRELTSPVAQIRLRPPRLNVAKTAGAIRTEPVEMATSKA
jgi:hypothetical protein